MSCIPKILGTSCTLLYESVKDALQSPMDRINQCGSDGNTGNSTLSSSVPSSPSTSSSSFPSYTYLLMGPYQSGKSSALEAVAHELAMDTFALTPECVQRDYPDDNARGLVQIFSSFLTTTPVSPSVSTRKPLLIIMDDIDVWVPYSSFPSSTAATPHTPIIRGQSVFTPKDDPVSSSTPRSIGGQRANTVDTDILHILFYYLRCINDQQLHGQRFSRPIFLAGITASVDKLNTVIVNHFQRPITFNALTVAERQQILSAYLLPSPSLTKEDIETLALSTGHGFLFGDLMNVMGTFYQLLHTYHSLPMARSLSSSSPYALLKSLLVSHTPYIMLSSVKLPENSDATAPPSKSSLTSTVPIPVQRLHETVRQLAGVINIEDNRQFLSDSSSTSSSFAFATDEEMYLTDKDENNPSENSSASSSSTHANLGFVFSGLGTLLRPSVSSVQWSDIVGLTEAKTALQQMVTWPLLPEKIRAMKNLHVLPPTGILLYGPPGTGKTLLAKAVANELGGRFINIPIAAILRSGLGDSEQALAAAFRLAEIAAPSVIFIDEIQALFMNRNSQDRNDESTRFAATLTAQFILSMDAIRRKMGTLNSSTNNDITKNRVLIMAATNVPEAIDPALLQPGRFDRIVYIGLPSVDDRRHLVSTYLSCQTIYNRRTNNILTNDEFGDLTNELVKGTENFSSADIKNMLQQSVSKAIFEYRLKNNNLMDILNGNGIMNPMGKENQDGDENFEMTRKNIPLYDEHFRTVLRTSQSSVDPSRLKYLKAWKP